VTGHTQLCDNNIRALFDKLTEGLTEEAAAVAAASVFLELYV